ncbi:MAG TPA: DUF3667 domain-containing protein [Gemmatimonadaceae bacterium]|nr:DUF3667 domain-containing protein [Gemmatimonadaceae bacterium]
MGVADPPRQDTAAELPAAVSERHSPNCLNCGATLSGAFCSQCGQRDIPPYPSIRELAIDAFWELSGWDGRFASTVRALVSRPGMLTREFLEGRRARYLSPLRLYLLASLLYFIVAAAVPDISGSPDSGIGLKFTPTRADSAGTAPERVAAAANKAMKEGNADPDPGKGGAALTPEQKAEALKDVEKAPPLLRPLLRRSIEDPARFKRGMLEQLPRMLFVLLPVFAAIVSLFYRGRKYPEHLYFAIHLNAFIFLALAIAKASRFTHSTKVAAIAGVIALVWIPVYATLAFRRTYGGGTSATIAREIGIGAIYGVAALIAYLLTIYFVALYG